MNFAPSLEAAPTVLFTYGTGGAGSSSVTTGVPGAVWKAKVDLTSTTIGAVPGTWTAEDFDDSTWVSLASQTGYGDSDENRAFTRVDYDAVTAGTQSGPSYLFRGTFSIVDLTAVASVTGEIKFDDGAAVYVNGTQILRTTNLDPVGTLTNYANFNGASARENATNSLTIPLNLLHTGVNTIAVEVHQVDAASPDVTFDFKLQVNYPLILSHVSPLANGHIVLTGQGAPLQSHTILVSSNLQPAVWTTLGTATPAADGILTYEDIAAPSFDHRFYRVSLP